MLVDFGLYFFHNAHALITRGTGPYFYLPKMESHLEARLWNDVFAWAQDKLGLQRGTVKATVLVETIMASFEMDEILWELREHSAGLNCGRWDYIFSFIKKFARAADRMLAQPKGTMREIEQAVPLGRLLRLFGLATGLDTQAPPEVANRNVSVRFSGLSMEAAIRKIFEGQPLDRALGKQAGALLQCGAGDARRP